MRRKPARRYQKQPLASGVDTTQLYARYQATQAEALGRRPREREQASARKERRIEAAKRSVQLKRAALKLSSMPRPAKKLMYSALTHALGEEIAAIKGLYRGERQAIDRQHRRSQWTDWLRHEAEMGDLQALAALRGRNRHGGLAGNTVSADSLPQRSAQPIGHDSITRKGTIIYRFGNGAIRDDGARLKVSLGADQAALQCALQMALERYGERISVNGSDAFREQILMAAVAGNLHVTFADAALEGRRLQLARASKADAETNAVSARKRTGGEGPGEPGRARTTGTTNGAAAWHPSLRARVDVSAQGVIKSKGRSR